MVKGMNNIKNLQATPGSPDFQQDLLQKDTFYFDNQSPDTDLNSFVVTLSPWKEVKFLYFPTCSLVCSVGNNVLEQTLSSFSSSYSTQVFQLVVQCVVLAIMFQSRYYLLFLLLTLHKFSNLFKLSWENRNIGSHYSYSLWIEF